ncbi:hypothetical protein, partial [Nodularia chucula]|uniref:hypothetical protein n=1 Tax=Nodularia chucula TaxID=3093667 RepID=UPI0039C5B23A
FSQIIATSHLEPPCHPLRLKTKILLIKITNRLPLIKRNKRFVNANFKQLPENSDSSYFYIEEPTPA